MNLYTEEQLKEIIEFAEWLEEFASTNWKKETKPGGKIRFIWSVPRKTAHGEWYSNWTTDALWKKFREEKE